MNNTYELPEVASAMKTTEGKALIHALLRDLNAEQEAAEREASEDYQRGVQFAIDLLMPITKTPEQLLIERTLFRVQEEFNMMVGAADGMSAKEHATLAMARKMLTNVVQVIATQGVNRADTE